MNESENPIEHWSLLWAHMNIETVGTKNCAHMTTMSMNVPGSPLHQDDKGGKKIATSKHLRVRSLSLTSVHSVLHLGLHSRGDFTHSHRM